MIQLTIEEALDSAEKTEGQCVYVYRDSDTIFYIGKSNRPCERLRQHLGQGDFCPYPDAVGRIIEDNMPQSLNWTVEIWTIQELEPDRYTDTTADMLVRDVEERWIAQYNPPFNSIGKTKRNPLPDRYIKHKIANTGVKLD